MIYNKDKAALTENPIILLVEDNPNDIIFTRHAFKKSGRPCRFQLAKNGEKAMDILHDKNEKKPDLILLDINLPKLNGKEVLKQIKTDANLKSIPTVMLTSSTSDVELAESYRLKADGYIHKPNRLNEYSDMVRSIEEFWFDSMYYPGTNKKVEAIHLPFEHEVSGSDLIIHVRRYQLTSNIVDQCLLSVFSIYNEGLVDEAKRVILDLSEVEFVDFSGLNFISAIQNLFEEKDCTFELTGISKIVMNALTETELGATDAKITERVNKKVTFLKCVG